jgi:undecaprenyl-diphosphatase
MTYIQALILSIIEGITEFLPISSTGHLILASHLMQISQTEFVKTFEIAIQFGAILAVVFLYGKKLLVEWNVLLRTIWVFIPTAVLGFLLYSFIKSYLLGNIFVTALSFLIGGIVIIVIERYFKTRKPIGGITKLSFKNALLLGVIQILSVIPGVSRSATTIFGGMFLGLSRKEATELSFLVAVPVMGAATGYDLLKSYENFTSSDFGILAFGMLISFLSAIVAIKWLISYVKTHDFTYFGIYRIIVALLFFLFML